MHAVNFTIKFLVIGISILTLFIQSTDTIKPSTTSSKDPFGIGSDEEDNLFTSAPAVSKPPPSTQPVKAEEVTYPKHLQHDVSLHCTVGKVGQISPCIGLAI